MQYPILRLCRIANAFTALADILAGYAVVQGTLHWAPELILLGLASAGLYTGGIVLNDRLDLDRDRRERPERPLPSGQVSLRAAHLLIGLLLGGGVVAAAMAGRAAGAGAGVPLSIAVVLVVVIAAYDGGLKETLLGPVAMGTCRGLNLLLGMSFAVGEGAVPWELHHYLVAGAMGVYVAGMTSYARHEADESLESRRTLAIGIGLVLAAILLLAAAYFPLAAARRALLGRPELWWLLLGVVSVPLIRRLVVTWAAPSPERIQQTVGLGIMSIIVFDACIAYLAAGTYAGLAVISLLLPALLLGRLFPPS